MRLKTLLPTATAFISIAWSIPAFAQDDRRDPPASSGQERAGVDDIIVTAERRAQNVQDVPAAISAFTGEALESRGIDNPTDLQQLVPSLTVTLLDRDATNLTLRGVGLQNTTLGGDPGVTLYMDGHYIQAGSFLLQDFLDVDRVEVQRGPQGTLYGRNSIGGNVNVISRRPSDTFYAMGSISIGNYSLVHAEGVLSGPISNSVRARLAIARETRDGFIENTVGRDLRNSDYLTIRGIVDVDLASNLLMTVSGYNWRDDGLIYGGIQEGAPPFRVAYNGPFGRRARAHGGSVDFDWSLGGLHLKSLTSYNRSNYALQNDGDLGPTGTSSVNQFSHTRTWSQELQLISPSTGPFRWVAGLYYYNERSDFTFRLLNPVTSPPTVAVLVEQGPAFLDSESMAAYAQADWSITDSLVLTGGLRYSHDNKDLASPLIHIVRVSGPDARFPGGPGPNQHGGFDAVTGKLSLDWHFMPHQMVYASYSRGYRTGGFNAGLLTHSTYDPEYVNAFELGLRSDWWDHRVRANITGYYYDYTNKQDPITLAGQVSYIGNAASLDVKGLEFELTVRPVAGFEINGMLSYTNARYGRFLALDPFHAAAGEIDVAGNSPAVTPHWKGSIGAQYSFNAGRLGQFTARVDYNYTGRYNFTYFDRPADENPAYDIINARVSWRPSNHWSLEFLATNIENDAIVYNQFPTISGINGYNYLNPREYWLRLRFEY